MTEESDADLVKRAETALSALPYREPDWDGLAERIVGAVGTAPSEDPALLAAPLPGAEDEGTLTSALVAATEAPVAATEASVAATEAPVAATETPVAATE